MFHFGNIFPGPQFHDVKGGGMLAFVPLMGAMAVALRPAAHLKQNIHSKSDHLAKPNFQYEKRQKELEKKRKKEEKLKRKQEKGNTPDDGVEAGDADDAETDATDGGDDAAAADK